ncbi:MAG: SpoIIIAH-like family protein [Defluviitaleaceae bacterium]|nr:SpoIIIAH-like family protein [Defluviitaleaceae bacterium]
MFVLKRNQIIITALVIMIAVAGYLSWSDSRTEATIGYLLTDQGEIAALIPDSGTLVGLFPEDYAGLAYAPWATTHDTAIAVSGDDYNWSSLTALELEDIIPLPANQLTEAGEAIFVNQSNESSFFVQARLNREQSRSSERSILTELINNNNVEQEQRAQAADAMLEIQRRIERETAAEALIESKGFAEVYVRISDNAVDVIVSQDTLTDAELAQIMDIIKRKTGVNETQIHISPMRR